MVCKGNEITCCNFNGTVGILWNLKWLSWETYLILLSFAVSSFNNSVSGDCAPFPSEKQFPVWISLFLKWFCQSSEIFLRCLIQRYYKRNLGSVSKGCFLLFLQFVPVRQMMSDPFLIGWRSLTYILTFVTTFSARAAAPEISAGFLFPIFV